MKWQDFLRDSEKRELDALDKAAEWITSARKMIRRKYKNRCESRMRAKSSPKEPDSAK